MAQQTLAYTNYDFDTLVTSLQDRLLLYPAWKDMYKSGTGQTMIELFAAVGTLVLYYIERRAEESYIETAQNLSSVINLVRLLGYQPKRNTSSAGSLTFTVPTAPIADISIPIGTICSTANGMKFITTQSVTIDTVNTSVTATGIQGSAKTVTFTSVGGANQTYNISDTKVENSNITVKVNDTTWTPQSSFSAAINTSQFYVIRTELDQTITIVFGNGTFGQTPLSGQIISVEYIQSEGLAGNVYTTDLITTLNSTIVVGGVQQPVTVTNSSTFTGGDNAETIEDIRINAPAVFATGQRAVTKADYAALIKGSPYGIADAVVFGENERNPPNPMFYNQVQICAILEDWYQLSPALQVTLGDWLKGRSMITVRYSFTDPTIVQIVPVMDVKMVAGASQTYVQQLISTAIENQFILGTTTFIGQPHRHSDVVRVVEETIGVDYTHIALCVEKTLEVGYDIYNPTYYAQSMVLLPAKVSNVQLFVNNTQIALDDGAGGWINLSTYTVTGGVDYTGTGLVSVHLTPTPAVGSLVYMRYQQDMQGDLITSETQICQWANKIVYTSIS